MELREEMRQNDFEMNLVEEYCERYCAIDHEAVWYGSMNFQPYAYEQSGDHRGASETDKECKRQWNRIAVKQAL